MRDAVEKFLNYLKYARNASPHTLRNYRIDLEQFAEYFAPPPGMARKPVPLGKIDHKQIREFVAHLHAEGLEKTSIARKLAAIRSFFKFCVREGFAQQNPARLVATPKLPKRIPTVLTAEEINTFLDSLARVEPEKGTGDARPRHRPGADEDESRLLLRRDRAILELLYASGLRVSELVGLDVADVDRAELMLCVRGKGRKERIVPFGGKAGGALDAYWPVRTELLPQQIR